MEVYRKRNQATKIVFPLINASSTSAYYTTSAWTSMTNASKTVYFWSDDTNTPTSATIAANPIQLVSTGEWYLVISASEISASSQYMSIKLKSDQILEQTILVRLTNYDPSNVFTSSDLINGNATSVTVSAYQNFPQVSVSAQSNHPTVAVSAYSNFPQVTVSANLDKTNYTVSSGSITAVAGNVTGSVGSVAGAVDSVTKGVTVTNGTIENVSNPVSVSAYTNFPQVYVSAGQVTNVTGNISGSVNNVVVPQSVTVNSVNVSSVNGGLYVGTSAYSNFPQVYVSAGQVTNVTGNISGSVNSVIGNIGGSVASVTNSVSVSAQTNHPTVTVSAYTNFPQVQVSSTTIPLSADVCQWIGTSPNVLQSGRVDAYVGSKGILNDLGLSQLSAVTATSVTDKTGYSITANSDKTNYTVSSGSITTVTNVTNPISVSAYTNFPQVYVSAGQVTNVTGNVSGSVNSVVGNVGGSVASVTNPVSVSAYTNFPQVYVSAGIITNINNPVSVSAQTNHPTVSVSAYANFPQVQVSAINSGVITNATIDSAVFTSSTNNILNASTSLYVVSGTVGYDIGLLPNINANAGAAIAGVPQNYTATADNITIGTRTAGNYSATWNADGTYFQITTSGSSAMDAQLNYLLGSTRVSQVTILGRFAAVVGRYVNVYAYNYTTSGYDLISNSTTRMNHSTTDTSYTYNLLPVHRNSTSGVGDVKIRFLAGQTNAGDNLYLDQVLVKGVVAGATPNDIAQATYDKMAVTVYEAGVWIDTINGYSGTDLGVYGIPTYPVNNITNAATIASNLGVKLYYFSPDSSVVLNQNSDNWQFKGRGVIGLGGQSIADAAFENVEWISGTSVGQDYVIDDCTLGNVTLDSGCIHNSEIYGTLTTCANGVYVIKRCVDANPAGLSAPTIVCAPSATYGFRDYRGGLQFNNMVSSNSVKLDGMGRVVIDSSCSGGDLTLRGFWQVTNNGTGVIITSSARYDNTIPVTVSAYQNFPQVYVSAGTITNITNSVAVSAQTNHPTVAVSAYTNFPQVTVSANLDKTNYTVSSGSITAVAGNVTGSVASVTNPVSVSAYTNFPQVYVSAGTVTASTVSDKTGYSLSNSVTVSAYTNFPQVTVSANLDKTNYTVSSGSITAVAGNITGSVASVTNPVAISAINGGLYVGTSAYTNFPQVYVSAGQVTNVTGNISGSVNNVVVPQSVTVESVNVSSVNGGVYLGTSAYTNFPQVYVSAGQVSANVIQWNGSSILTPAVSGVPVVDVRYLSGSLVDLSLAPLVTVSANNDKTGYSLSEPVTVSAYTNFPQVTVSANLDKTNYTVSSGSITSVAGNITGSVASVTNPVIVSAYQNFPQTQVSAINGGLYVGTSAYTNFPQVYVSAGQITNVTGNISGSVNNVVVPQSVTVNSVNVSSVNSGVYIGTSAYTNFPQVTVSANLDKVNYTVSSGSITAVNGNITGSVNSVTNPVSVSAYTNFPQVQVSGINSGIYVSAVGPMTVSNPVQVSAINGGLYVGTSAYTNFPQVYVSAGTVTASTVSDKTGYSLAGSVNVSAYTNFPQVTVSANLDKTNYTVSSGSITAVAGSVASVTNPVSISAINGGLYVGTSAYTNFPQVYVSAGQVTNVTGNVSGSVNSVVVPQNVAVGSVNVSSVDSGAITSADLASDVYNQLNVVLTTNHGEGSWQSTSGSSVISANVVQWKGVTPNDLVGGKVDANATASATVSVGSVNVSSVDGGVYVGTSAYTNFPQVTVSANLDKINYTVSSGSITAVAGNVTGSVASVTNPVTVGTNNDKTGYTVSAGTIGIVSNPVSVSAYTNFPQVYVSAGTVTASTILDKTGYSLAGSVGVSAYTNFPQVYVSAGQVTNVTGNVSGSVNSVIGNVGGSVNSVTNSVSVSAQTNHPAVSVSAYTNFPQVTVSANLDKTNYTVSSGSVTAVNGNITGSVVSVTNPVIVSAYQNFPSVNISAVNSGVITSADFDNDYWNKVQSLDTTVTIGKVQVSGIDGGLFVGTSAYTNFPQVYVSAGTVTASSVTDKTGYTVTAGNVDNLTNPVSVSAYRNFPQVYVSAGNVTATSVTDKTNYTVSSGSISSVNGNVTGSVASVTNPVTVGTNNDKTGYSLDGSVGVSAYSNFPQVTVSANLDKTNYTVSSGSITAVNGNVTGSVASVTNSVSVSAQNNHPIVAVSAYSNFPQVTVSANLDKTNYTVSSGLVDSVTNPVTVNNYQNFPSVNVSSVDDETITSADFDNDYWDKVQSLSPSVTVGKVQVSGIDSGVYVGTSAYSNFPQVYVSAMAPGIEISATVVVDYNKVMSAAISAIDQRFTFSGGELIVDTDSIVNAIMNSVIDTKTFEEIIEILLAMASGRITRSNNLFTYYKQNNTSQLFTLESERNERTRL